MFPGVNGFHLTFGHIFFVSIFCAVALVVATTFVLSAWRGWRDRREQSRLNLIRWQSEFHDLNSRERRCRHMINGEVENRLCPNAFDCRGCENHAHFLPQSPFLENIVQTYGLNFPGDRYYHRGHAWVHPETDGTFTIGLDDLGRRLVGRADNLQLPSPGERIENNSIAWRGKRDGVEFRILAPMDGEVVEVGGPRKDFYLRVKPEAGQPVNLAHLLHGGEVSAWLRDELERLQLLLSPAATGPSLADGGVLMDDLRQAQPDANWDHITGAMLLEP